MSPEERAGWKELALRLRKDLDALWLALPGVVLIAFVAGWLVGKFA